MRRYMAGTDVCRTCLSRIHQCLVIWETDCDGKGEIYENHLEIGNSSGRSVCSWETGSAHHSSETCYSRDTGSPRGKANSEQELLQLSLRRATTCLVRPD